MKEVRKEEKLFFGLILFISLLAVAAALAGLFSGGGAGPWVFQSVGGEWVQIVGEGIYRNDSLSYVAQGKASDLVTLILGVPLLMLSAYFQGLGSFRGRLMTTGLLGYFLYTYMSYTFLWNYNSLFLVYVALMSASLAGLIWNLMGYDYARIKDHFHPDLPTRFLSGILFFIGWGVAALWLGKIGTSLLSGAPPAGLDHYTTLVIQGMDLGFVVPAALTGGILLLKGRPAGYILSSAIIIKGAAMLTAMSAMMISMKWSGVPMSTIEILLFPAFNILMILALVLLMKKCK